MFPWNKKESTALTTDKPSEPSELVLADKDQDVVVYQGHPIATKPHGGTAVQVRAKPLKINGKVYDVDPKQLIRMIKQITQTIGEYKERDNVYSGYVVSALRKCRSDMISDLEQHFHIHWEIDEASGRSIFYM